MTLNTNEYRHYHCHSWFNLPQLYASKSLAICQRPSQCQNVHCLECEHIPGTKWTHHHVLNRNQKSAKKNRKWEKTLKHIPSILTKQMDISIIIYIYKTKIRIYILYIHVYNHTNIKPPSFVVVLGSKHHDMLHRAAKTKFRWTVGSTSWFLKQIMGMFILAKWWKHPHDSPCPYSFPFVEVKSGDFMV